MSLFIAPLFRTGISASSEKVEIAAKFFPPNLQSIEFEVVFTRNSNAMALGFSNLDTASQIEKFIKESFGTTLATKARPLPASAPSIPLPVRYNDPRVPNGLLLIPDYVSVTEEVALITEIDSEAWDTTIRRRVQHYGFKFEYSKLAVDTGRPVKPFPPKCDELTHRSELSDHGFNQLTINEYVPGIGIASHCDTHSSFTDIIAVVSLGAPINMDFVSDCGSEKVSVDIPSRSLFFMAGDSRYGWRHGVAGRKTDRDVEGILRSRGRRISLTWRNCVEKSCDCRFPSLCNSQGADVSRPRRMTQG